MFFVDGEHRQPFQPTYLSFSPHLVLASIYLTFADETKRMFGLFSEINLPLGVKHFFRESAYLLLVCIISYHREFLVVGIKETSRTCLAKWSVRPSTISILLSPTCTLYCSHWCVWSDCSSLLHSLKAFICLVNRSTQPCLRIFPRPSDFGPCRPYSVVRYTGYVFHAMVGYTPALHQPERTSPFVSNSPVTQVILLRIAPLKVSEK